MTGTVFGLIPEEGSGPVRARVERPFRSILRAPGMGRLLLVGALYIVVLQAILSYMVPSARAAGLSAFWAGFTYFAVNVTAMVARLVWGKVADRQGGSRRVRTLVETGIVGSIGGLVFALALHSGAALVLPAAVLFGFGALGWNALLYVIAGERTPADLAGRSVAVAATVVFLISAACTPLARSARRSTRAGTSSGSRPRRCRPPGRSRRQVSAREPFAPRTIARRSDPPRSRGFAAT